MNIIELQEKTSKMIANLKDVCRSAGLGNDGNEFKIIVQVILYKFLNDKFVYELKNIYKNDAELAKVNFEDIEELIQDYKERFSDYKSFYYQYDTTLAMCPEHLFNELFKKQNEANFHEILDDTLIDIADFNKELFYTKTTGEERVRLFEAMSGFIVDSKKKASFARSLLTSLAGFSFGEAIKVDDNYDYFSKVFEDLIKSYNTDSGSTYAEYYTPHSVSTIMASLLVDKPAKKNVTCYDPSAGTGTLLMSLAHKVGTKKSTIYAQDISQKSNKLLKLNLILNNLIPSLDKVIQGDTLLNPFFKDSKGGLQKFDYVVSNPPFKTDFSDIRDELANNHSLRFWAGVPTVPKSKAKTSPQMNICACFFQHVINSLNDKGKGAIVLPTGFITSNANIEKNILKHIVDNKILSGVISMPSNIFASTGTNVSVVFLDKDMANRKEEEQKVILIDASSLGNKVKEGGKQRTVLSNDDVNKIINTFHNKEEVSEFSALASYDEIREKDYSLSPGQYFKIEMEEINITPEEFEEQMAAYEKELKELFSKSNELEKEILTSLKKLNFKG